LILRGKVKVAPPPLAVHEAQLFSVVCQVTKVSSLTVVMDTRLARWLVVPMKYPTPRLTRMTTTSSEATALFFMPQRIVPRGV